jgi:hypothetical protein
MAFQAFVSQSAIETLNESVLHRPTWLDELQRDLRAEPRHVAARMMFIPDGQRFLFNCDTLALADSMYC